MCVQYYKCSHVEEIATSSLLGLCIMPPEIRMTSLVTFGLISVPYAVIFLPFLFFYYGEISMYFKRSFDSSDNNILTVQSEVQSSAIPDGLVYHENSC